MFKYNFIFYFYFTYALERLLSIKLVTAVSPDSLKISNNFEIVEWGGEMDEVNPKSFVSLCIFCIQCNTWNWLFTCETFQFLLHLSVLAANIKLTNLWKETFYQRHTWLILQASSWSPVEKVPRLPLKNTQFCELLREENLYKLCETQSVWNFNNLGLLINSANVFNEHITFFCVKMSTTALCFLKWHLIKLLTFVFFKSGCVSLLCLICQIWFAFNFVYTAQYH